MVLKTINATEVRNGTNILIDGEAYSVKKFDISKTGKHGHSKVRVEAVGIINGKKKVFVVPGHDKLEVPMIDKRRAQVLSKGSEEGAFSIMDLENYETLEVMANEDLKEDIKEGDQVEYWDVEGQKIIKRKF